LDVVTGRSLIDGRGKGPLVRLTQPISFWGGVDPVAGTIVDPRHPQQGTSIVGCVLAIPATVGSSSSSAIMLELLREGTAPAAILMQRPDAIVALGVVVARELGYASIPIVEVCIDALGHLPEGTLLEVADGHVELAS
jgi:predicted aconitase with swiveling domain